jgi:hypothetical protein
MAEDKFKLPRSSYEEICKIIKAYGRLTEPASLDEVAQLCAMNRTAISANNAFLANIELIQGGKRKSATPKGSELARALEHELPDQIQERWARVVRDNEFLGKMAAAVKIRGKMDSSALESHIAYSAGEGKSAAVMTGARAVMDVLRAAGVVREHEGQLISTEIVTDDVKRIEQGSLQIVVPTGRLTTQIGVPRGAVAQTTGVSLHVELRIDAKPSELDGLGEKIQQLLRELNKPSEDDGANNS